MRDKIKALVISDDPQMLAFLNDNLGKNGCRVICTRSTGEDLKALLDEEMPGLVILDIMMPALDGIEVCLRIRHWSAAPIMMLSTWGAARGQVRGLDLSAESYLTEPFGAEAFRRRLDAVLRQDFVASRRREAGTAATSLNN